MTSVGEGAFRDCKSLTSINLPDSVKSLGAWAFAGCERLEHVNLPLSVEAVGTSAFSDCTKAKVVCKRKKPLFGMPKKWSKDMLGSGDKAEIIWDSGR